MLKHLVGISFLVIAHTSIGRAQSAPDSQEQHGAPDSVDAIIRSASPTALQSGLDRVIQSEVERRLKESGTYVYFPSQHVAVNLTARNPYWAGAVRPAQGGELLATSRDLSAEQQAYVKEALSSLAAGSMDDIRDRINASVKQQVPAYVSQHITMTHNGFMLDRQCITDFQHDPSSRDELGPLDTTDHLRVLSGEKLSAFTKFVGDATGYFVRNGVQALIFPAAKLAIRYPLFSAPLVITLWSEPAGGSDEEALEEIRGAEEQAAATVDRIRAQSAGSSALGRSGGPGEPGRHGPGGTVTHAPSSSTATGHPAPRAAPAVAPSPPPPPPPAPHVAPKAPPPPTMHPPA